MSKASEQVPLGDSCRPSSHISVIDPDNPQLQSESNGKKDDGGGSKCVLPPPDGAVNPGPASSGEESTSQFSLARLLRSLLPHVSLILENTGSVARDHLANERTWLAYVRTSLAIAGTGVALVQLFTISESTGASKLLGTGVSLRNFARPLGATTVLLALIILGIGVLRYFKIQAAMAQGQFPAARGTVVIITAALAALVAITFGILAALPS